MAYKILAGRAFRKMKNKRNDKVASKKVQKNRIEQINSIKDKQYHNFSIITSSYNSADYLDDYFESIVTNKYDLSKIEIILVDDGSIDNSKEIIDMWIEKFPNNIKYYYQENSGQSKARNEGIKLATNDWITFIDSDDFVSDNYFDEINNAINISNGESTVIANIHNYIESTGRKRNTHPLKYRYRSGINYRNANLLSSEYDFYMHITTAFMKRVDVLESGIIFEDIKPYFEDGKFILDYMLETGNYNVCYVREAIYYYRKRSVANSTIDLSKNDDRRYVDLLNNAYLPVLRKYKEKFGEVPMFLQNEIYYDLKWNLTGYDNAKIELEPEKYELRLKYLQEIFSYLDFDNLSEPMNLRFIDLYYILGINKVYYDNKYPNKGLVYYYYETNNWTSFELFSCDNKWSIEVDGVAKDLSEFETRTFIKEHNNKEFIKDVFVKIPKPYKTVKFLYENQEQEINRFIDNFEEKHFNPKSRIILFDRIDKADDNAEVFYDWMQKNHPEYKNIMFAIDKNADDYERLKKKGFNLINYSSKKFDIEYLKADYILSSALDQFIVNYKNHRYHNFRTRSRFIFLQHGVVAQNISGFLGGKKYDKIVASTHNEANEFRHEPYNFFDDQVIECGLPRHDLLINNPKNVILFQPTWRHNLRDLTEEEFAKSDYATSIIGFLTDKKLLALLKQHKFELHFLLHPSPAMVKYYEFFKQYENEFIKVLNPINVIYREKLCEGKIQITDYSSVRFDFAFMKKPVLLIHTDPEEFSKTHICEARDDYDTTDVGKVVETYTQLVDEIEVLLNNDCKMEQKYFDRIDEMFINHDQKNCQKLFDALTKY